MANTIAIAFLGPVDRGRGVSDRFLAFAEARGCIAFTASVENDPERTPAQPQMLRAAVARPT